MFQIIMICVRQKKVVRIFLIKMSATFCNITYEYLQRLENQLFLNSVGVWFVYFLNEELKEDFELKPT
jgi:hypothetical protein